MESTTIQIRRRSRFQTSRTILETPATRQERAAWLLERADWQKSECSGVCVPGAELWHTSLHAIRSEEVGIHARLREQMRETLVAIARGEKVSLPDTSGEALCRWIHLHHPVEGRDCWGKPIKVQIVEPWWIDDCKA